ncbi:hypothetical protein KC950_03920 [Candidatus Saccharibacteria bacterium]|nr:hypothetical protein [Candidatus Saccharibacteria bacterium]
MESDSSYEYSDYLKSEATKNDVLIEEVWEAVMAREAIIDHLAAAGGMSVREIKDSGYFSASQKVRDLQRAYDIEPYTVFDE